MNDSSFILAKRDANKKALEQVEKATDSEPVKGKELLESDGLKRKLSEARRAVQVRIIAEEGEVRVTLAISQASRSGRPEKGQRRKGNEPHRRIVTPWARAYLPV